MLISRPSVCSLPYNFGPKCNSWPLITSHKISRLIFQRDFPFSMAQHFSAGERDDKAFAATKKEIDRSRPPQNQPGSIRTVFHCTKRETQVAGAWTERKKMFHGGSLLKLADDDVYIENPKAQNQEVRGF